MIKFFHTNPYLTGIFFWFLFFVIYFLALLNIFIFSEIVLLLLALNFASLTLYGIDKLSALMNLRRIPERILILSALFGGPIGAVLGMYIFKHKTKKITFQFWLSLAILAEVGLIFIILY